MNKLLAFFKNMFGSRSSGSSVGKAVLGTAAGVATGMVMKKASDALVENAMKKAQAEQVEALKQAGVSQPVPSSTQNPIK